MYLKASLHLESSNRNTCHCEINWCLKSITDDLVIMSDKILDTLETVAIDFNKKRKLVKWENFQYFTCLLITISLLIIVSVVYVSVIA